jgi:transposase-like protein
MSADKDGKSSNSSKKCPECLTYIPVNVYVCPSCKKRVGKVTGTGMAKKVTDWKAYIMLILAVAAFIFYIWWAFLRE